MSMSIQSSRPVGANNIDANQAINDHPSRARIPNNEILSLHVGRGVSENLETREKYLKDAGITSIIENFPLIARPVPQPAALQGNDIKSDSLSPVKRFEKFIADMKAASDEYHSNPQSLESLKKYFEKTEEISKNFREGIGYIPSIRDNRMSSAIVNARIINNPNQNQITRENAAQAPKIKIDPETVLVKLNAMKKVMEEKLNNLRNEKDAIIERIKSGQSFDEDIKNYSIIENNISTHCASISKLEKVIAGPGKK